jgi:hypothetical protein
LRAERIGSAVRFSFLRPGSKLVMGGGGR